MACQGVLPPLPPKRFFHASSDPDVVAQRREKLDSIVQTVLRQCIKDDKVQVQLPQESSSTYPLMPTSSVMAGVF